MWLISPHKSTCIPVLLKCNKLHRSVTFTDIAIHTSKFHLHRHINNCPGRRKNRLQLTLHHQTCEETDKHTHLSFKLFLVHISVLAHQHSVCGGLCSSLGSSLAQTHSAGDERGRQRTRAHRTVCFVCCRLVPSFPMYSNLHFHTHTCSIGPTAPAVISLHHVEVHQQTHLSSSAIYLVSSSL